jgi:hypothetical protein
MHQFIDGLLRRPATLKACVDVNSNHTSAWPRTPEGPHARDEAEISYFFSFIPPHLFMRVEKKEASPIKMYTKRCLTKKFNF